MGRELLVSLAAAQLTIAGRTWGPFLWIQLLVSQCSGQLTNWLYTGYDLSSALLVWWCDDDMYEGSMFNNLSVLRPEARYKVINYFELEFYHWFAWILQYLRSSLVGMERARWSAASNPWALAEVWGAWGVLALPPWSDLYRLYVLVAHRKWACHLGVLIVS